MRVLMGSRLKNLRINSKISQVDMAKILGVQQSSINRYETGQSAPTPELLLKYANFFNVSLDYLYGRTDNPEGCLFSNDTNFKMPSPDMEDFVEMLFDNNSSANKQIKAALLQILREGSDDL